MRTQANAAVHTLGQISLRQPKTLHRQDQFTAPSFQTLGLTRARRWNAVTTFTTLKCSRLASTRLSSSSTLLAATKRPFMSTRALPTSILCLFDSVLMLPPPPPPLPLVLPELPLCVLLPRGTAGAPAGAPPAAAAVETLGPAAASAAGGRAGGGGGLACGVQLTGAPERRGRCKGWPGLLSCCGSAEGLTAGGDCSPRAALEARAVSRRLGWWDARQGAACLCWQGGRNWRSPPAPGRCRCIALRRPTTAAFLPGVIFYADASAIALSRGIESYPLATHL